MTIATQVTNYAGKRLTRRLSRTVPFVGGLVALAMVGGAMRRKGFLRGALDTVLNFIPVVGTAKNVAEAARGRDFIQPKPRLR